MTDEELRQLFAGVSDRFDRIDGNVATLQQNFDRLNAKVETLHENTLHQIDHVAEVVASVDQKIERVATDLSARIEKGAVETQAMIRFSHAELDRRMHALEETVADLQARVERLESPRN